MPHLPPSAPECQFLFCQLFSNVIILGMNCIYWKPIYILVHAFSCFSLLWVLGLCIVCCWSCFCSCVVNISASIILIWCIFSFTCYKSWTIAPITFFPSPSYLHLMFQSLGSLPWHCCTLSQWLPSHCATGRAGKLLIWRVVVTLASNMVKSGSDIEDQTELRLDKMYYLWLLFDYYVCWLFL